MLQGHLLRASDIWFSHLSGDAHLKKANKPTIR